MRIEDFLQQALPSARQEQLPPLAQTGDVIRAAVLSQDEENVVLKTGDGRIFQAKLSSEALLQPNDNTELLVVDSSPGKLVLRLVFVEPAVTNLPALSEKAVSIEVATEPEMTELLTVFAGKEGKPAAQVLANAQQTMREHGVDAQTAAFFAANGIEVTDDSLEALRQIVQGNTVGISVVQAAQLIPQKTEETNIIFPAAIIREQTRQGQNSVRIGAPVPAENSQVLQETAKVQAGGTNSAVQTTVLFDDGRETPMREADGKNVRHQISEPTDTATGQSGKLTNPVDTTSKTTDVQIVLRTLPRHVGEEPRVQDEDVAFDANTPKEPRATIESLQPENRISAGVLKEKILSMFLKADDDLDGQAVKSAAADVKNRLLLLQEIVKHNDINDKQSVTTRLHDAQTQIQLMEDISRFVYLQIPLRMRGDETAELYVYKRNRKGGRIDPENTSILLGISTESLGRVEAMLRVEKRAISLSFGVENAAMIPEFRAGSAELKKMLSDLQYLLAEYKVSGLAEPTTPLNAEERLLETSKNRRFGSMEYMV